MSLAEKVWGFNVVNKCNVQDYFRTLTIIGVLAVLSLNYFLIFYLTPVEVDLDSGYSWAFSHQSAFSDEWKSIFTFGPLGFVVGRFFGFPHQLAVKLLYQFFIAAIGTYASYEVGRVIATKFLFRLAISILVLASIASAGEYVLLMAVLYLGMLEVLELRRLSSLDVLLFSVAGAMAFFIKLPQGISVFGTLILALLLRKGPLRSKMRITVASVSLFLVAAGGIWGAFHLSFSDLLRYFSTSLETISGYSKSMTNYWGSIRGNDYIQSYGQWKDLVFRMLGSIFLFWLGLVFAFKKKWRVYVLLFFPFALVFKHSMTRIGVVHVNHLPIFLKSLTVFLVPLILFKISGRLSLKLAGAAFFCAGLGALYFVEGHVRSILADSMGKLVNLPVDLRFIESLRRASNIEEHLRNRQRQEAVNRETAKFPEEFLNQIGSSAVDFYPWSLFLAPLYDLNYRPRPAPVSFQGYTRRLDVLNKEHLLSSNAPDYMVFRNDLLSLDEIYVAWSEPETFRVILDRYHFGSELATYQLGYLQNQSTFAESRMVHQEQVPWNEWIPVPYTNYWLFVEVGIHPHLPIRIRNTLLRSEPVTIEVKCEDGTLTELRFLPANSGGGLLITPFARSSEEISLLMQKKLKVRPVEIRFLSKAYGPRDDLIELRWLEFQARN